MPGIWELEAEGWPWVQGQPVLVSWRPSELHIKSLPQKTKQNSFPNYRFFACCRWNPGPCACEYLLPNTPYCEWSYTTTRCTVSFRIKFKTKGTQKEIHYANLSVFIKWCRKNVILQQILPFLKTWKASFLKNGKATNFKYFCNLSKTAFSSYAFNLFLTPLLL